MTDKLNNLPPVAQMMRDAGLEPKKQFGQNFIFDLNLTGRIARAVPNIENMTVVEVGPGPGGLTRALLSAGARRVIAIEKDPMTKPILDKIVAASDGRLDVIYGDALKESPEPRAQSENYAICANLPYNIGTELLINWLHQIRNQKSEIINSMTLMFQREVADRIVAAPGSKQYGRLSILVSLVSDAKILFNVPNIAFYPAPRVQSAVVQIIPKKHNIDLARTEKLTAKLFGARRKMIRGSFPNANWAQFGLNGTERPEDLPPEKFAELAAVLI